MSENNPKTILDGFTRLSLGVDSGNPPEELPQNQCSFAINATFRGKYARQRPVYVKRQLTFFDTDPEIQAALQSNFENGLFQHASNYSPSFEPEYPIVAIGGRIFRIDLTQNYSVQEISIPGDLNPNNRNIGWACQAEQFWIFNEGQSRPLIWDGATMRRATAYEIKPGRQIACSGARLWYALPDRIHFRATDLSGSSSGTAAYNFTDALLRETENSFLNSGGDFSVPANSGGITAIHPSTQLDASQGQGPLQVFCKRIAFSVNAPTDRETWKNLNYPILTQSLIEVGSESQDSTVSVNSDLWMRSRDGLRSFIIARRDFGGSWGNTPQSFEMSRVLDMDQRDLLPWSKALEFNRRLLITCSPAYSDHGIFHRGLIALDFSPTGSLLTKGNPDYDGVWTGLRVLQHVISQGRCFLFVLSQDKKINLWELLEDIAPGYLDNGETPVQWEVQSRALFGPDIFNLKKLYSGDLSYDQLFGTTTFEARFRPDSYPCWIPWPGGGEDTWSECVEKGCPPSDNPPCTPQPPHRRGYRPKFRLPEPPASCLPEGASNLGQNFQVSLKVTGPARIKGFRVKAHVQPEAEYAPSKTDECEGVTCCDDDIFSYSSEGVG